MQKNSSIVWVVFLLFLSGCSGVFHSSSATSEKPAKITPPVSVSSLTPPPRMAGYEPYKDYEVSRDQVHGTYLGTIHPQRERSNRRRVMAATDDVVRVAILLPLSGKASQLGWSMQNAAQLALFQSKKKDVVLQFYDTKGTTDGAVHAIEDVLKSYPDIIVGPVFSDNVKIVRDRADGVPVVSFTTDPSAISSDAYSMGLLQSYQVERILDYAVKQGKRRVAVIAPNDSMGRVSYRSAKETLSKRGAKIVEYGFYQPGDFKSIEETVKQLANYDERHQVLLEKRKELKAAGQIQALEDLEHVDTLGELNFDSVLILSSGRDLKKISSFLRYYEINPKTVQYLGTAIWDQDFVLMDPNFIRGWYVAPDSRYQSTFDESYRAAFEDKEPKALASLSYDAVAMISLLSKDGQFNSGDLTQANGFFGVDGVFRLRSNGQAERGLEVRRIVAKGKAVVIEKAPQTFEKPMYKN